MSTSIHLDGESKPSNMLLLAAPKLVLYLVSIFVAWLCGRPRAARPV